MEKYDKYIQQELDFVKKHFDVEKVFEFQTKHNVEIVRGADWQYECHIDREGAYAISLTFLDALIRGIMIYEKHEKEKPA